jgi:Ribonuclease G/E
MTYEPVIQGGKMTNDKQQTAVDSIIELCQELLGNHYSISHDGVCSEVIRFCQEQAKEKYEHEMCLFADEYASYVQEQSKEGIKGAMVSMCAWTFFKNRRTYGGGNK